MWDEVFESWQAPSLCVRSLCEVSLGKSSKREVVNGRLYPSPVGGNPATELCSSCRGECVCGMKLEVVVCGFLMGRVTSSLWVAADMCAWFGRLTLSVFGSADAL